MCQALYLVMAAAAAAALVGSAAAVDDEMAELAAMLREQCGGETGVDFSLIDKVNAGTPLMPDPKLKCYIKCLMETAGMLSEGAVDLETTLALLPDELRQKTGHIITACGTKKGSDDCDTAFLTQVCWQQGGGDSYFLI